MVAQKNMLEYKTNKMYRKIHIYHAILFKKKFTVLQPETAGSLKKISCFSFTQK